MVPEHDELGHLNLLDPGHDQPHYIGKISTESELKDCTYDFPRGRRCGLKSTDLNRAKKSSQGAAS